MGHGQGQGDRMKYAFARMTALGSMLALTLGAAGLQAQVPLPQPQDDAAPATEPVCQREIVVLGAGQDAGAPQIGQFADTGPRLLPASLGLIDRTNGARYLFDMTPAITEQMQVLAEAEPSLADNDLDGVFLTHAHIGHYLGLAWLGREADNASGVPVHAMPRMAEFLRTNGPWSQLVELGNIELREMSKARSIVLQPGLIVVPFEVPHRDEYSETVGFMVLTSGKGFVYLPDIDSWEAWESAGPVNSLRNKVDAFDYLFLDATFHDDGELPGRDMSEIPHPRVTETMERLSGMPEERRARVNFIHYNHTNPIRDPDSEQSRAVLEGGFNIARRGQSFCLD